MTAEEAVAALVATLPIRVAERVEVAVYEGEPIAPEDAATLVSWMKELREAVHGPAAERMAQA